MKTLCYCIVTLAFLRNFLFASDLDSSKFYEDEFGFIKANPSFKIDGPLPTGFRKLLETTASPQPSDGKKEKRSIGDSASKLLLSSEVKEEMIRQMHKSIVMKDDLEDEKFDVKLESPNNFLTRIPLMYNEINGQYQGKVGVGTPPQYFSLIFDTASSDLWIRSDKCEYKNADIGNPGIAKSFKNWLSSSYEKMNSSVDNRYASGRIKGVTAMEVVQLGNLTIKNQIIVEALLLQDLPHTHFDGIFGLSPKDDRHYLMSPFYNMVLQDLIPAPLFSLYLSDKKNEIIFGGVDPNYYIGEFTFVDTLNQMTDHWRFLFKGVYVDDKELSKRGCLGIVDSGSDFLMGSRELIDAIMEAVDPNKVTTKVQEGYVVECSDVNQLREIKFKTMDNKFLLLTPEEYVKKTVINDCEFCYTPFLVLDGLKTSDSTPILCFGSIFLKKYYTQFDVKGNKIGFAIAQ